MLLATIIISSITVSYIKQENIKAKAQSQRFLGQSAEEILKPGAVGEVKDINSLGNTDTASQNFQIPPVIFNASGIISEIKSDRLIARGDGSNFADGGARDLSAFFTVQTTVFIKSDQEIIKYVGFEGLKYLKVGDNILMEGEENLRGKTQFVAKTINILQ